MGTTRGIQLVREQRLSERVKRQDCNHSWDYHFFFLQTCCQYTPVSSLDPLVTLLWPCRLPDLFPVSGSQERHRTFEVPFHGKTYNSILSMGPYGLLFAVLRAAIARPRVQHGTPMVPVDPARCLAGSQAGVESGK